MKNRAKCKLCKSIIESFHTNDYVICKCGEISLYGGADKLECGARDWENFIRVDDQGNEIIVKVIDKQAAQAEESQGIDQDETHQALARPNKKELLKLLESQISTIEGLPPSAMTMPITHYDYVSGLLLMLAIFKSDSPN